MIVGSNPADGLDRAEMAWFDSDALANADAIREIDCAAAQYGLVRTGEYWLKTFTLPDGRVVRRGFCYRPGPSDLSDRAAARRKMDQVGKSSQQIIREFRDE